MKHSIEGLVCLVLVTLLLTLPVGRACGQTFQSSLSGVVMDPSGNRIPNAKLDLVNTATNDRHEAVSGPDGNYKFTSLSPGTYELTAQAQGFKKLVRKNMQLLASTAAGLDLTLELGTLEQSVEVTAQAVLLDTESANTTSTLNSNLLAALPTNTRTPLNFVFALAGTTEAQGGMTGSGNTQDQMFSMFGLQGGRSGQAEILLDGAPSTAVDWGGLMVSPTVDAVQEMQLIQNTYDAQYAKAGGGVISLVTKGGSNEFHGVAYDFLQNDNLNALNWADKTRWGNSKGEFKRNQFGGNISGPIWKRKNLFFLFAYEGLRQPFTSNTVQTIPTESERAGDFSQTLNAQDGSLDVVYNPFSTVQLPDGTYTRTAFDGNKIPSTLLDPVGQKVAALYPQANRPGSGFNLKDNYVQQGKGSTINDKIEYRVDWTQSEKNRIFLRTSQRLRQSVDPACFYCNGADNDYTLTSPGWQTTLNDTFTPSATWIINGLISASRWAEGQASLSYGIFSPGQLGLHPQDYQIPVMPNFGVTGYNGLGNNTLRQQVRYTDSAELNVTKLFAKHTFKFGGDFRLWLINNRDDVSGGFNFGRDLTSCDPAEGGGSCQALNYDSEVTGNGLAGLLLGVGGGSTTIRPDKAMSIHFFGLYFQDDWKVSPRLTVNLGLRYENQRPATERFNRMAAFDPNATNPLNGQVPYDGTLKGAFFFADPNHRTIWDPNNKDFAPRVGIAYKLTDKLVARGGFGIFFNPSTAMISFDQGMYLGYTSDTYWQSTEGSLGYIPTTRLNNPFPNGVIQPTGNTSGNMTRIGEGAGEIWLKGPHPDGYKSQFSFGLQYEIKSGSVIEASYTGWRGRKLMYGNPNININQILTEQLSMGSQLDQEVANPFEGVFTQGYTGPTIPFNQLIRPFPEYGDMTLTRSLPGAVANFDALYLRFQHNFSGGLNVLTTYQYSKTMDNGSEDYIGWSLGNSWRDSRNTMLDYTISQHDVPHSFVTAFSYDLPFGKGRKFGSGLPGAVNHIVGGWGISGVVKLATGMPIFPVNWNMWSNPIGRFGFPGHTRPDLVGNPVPAEQNPEHWISPDAFAAPPEFMYGNAPRLMDSLRESPVRNFDLSVGKTFRYRESLRMEFRAEFLNAFNTPQFGGGGEGWENIRNVVTWGDLGWVNGTRNAPRNIQLGLKLVY